MSISLLLAQSDLNLPTSTLVLSAIGVAFVFNVIIWIWITFFKKSTPK